MNSNLIYSPETANLGQIRRFLEPCDLEIWQMTLKNNRATLLSNIKLYASILSSYVNSNWSYSPETVKLGCDLCDLDLWPWPFAWTLRRSLVITAENFMMIRWWEHSQKGVTDRRTENTICRAAWSQLKIAKYFFCWLWENPEFIFINITNVSLPHFKMIRENLWTWER